MLGAQVSLLLFVIVSSDFDELALLKRLMACEGP